MSSFQSQISKGESGQILSIAGILAIGGAEELRNVLRDFLDAASCPVVDLSHVETVDAAALQVLCSARRSAEHFGKVLGLAAVSPAVRDTSEALGLSLAELGALASAERGAADGL